jgi:hypothetical protein
MSSTSSPGRRRPRSPAGLPGPGPGWGTGRGAPDQATQAAWEGGGQWGTPQLQSTVGRSWGCGTGGTGGAYGHSWALPGALAEGSAGGARLASQGRQEAMNRALGPVPGGRSARNGKRFRCVSKTKRGAVFEKQIPPGALPGVGTGSNVAEGRLCLLARASQPRVGTPSCSAGVAVPTGLVGSGPPDPSASRPGPGPRPGEEGWRGHGGEAPGGDRLNPVGPGDCALGGRGTGATRSGAERERCRQASSVGPGGRTQDRDLHLAPGHG